MPSHRSRKGSLRGVSAFCHSRRPRAVTASYLGGGRGGGGRGSTRVRNCAPPLPAWPRAGRRAGGARQVPRPRAHQITSAWGARARSVARRCPRKCLRCASCGRLSGFSMLISHPCAVRGAGAAGETGRAGGGGGAEGRGPRARGRRARCAGARPLRASAPPPRARRQTHVEAEVRRERREALRRILRRGARPEEPRAALLPEAELGYERPQALRARARGAGGLARRAQGMGDGHKCGSGGRRAGARAAPWRRACAPPRSTRAAAASPGGGRSTQTRRPRPSARCGTPGRRRRGAAPRARRTRRRRSRCAWGARGRGGHGGGGRGPARAAARSGAGRARRAACGRCRQPGGAPSEVVAH